MYAGPTMPVTFFEIDPLVARVATDTRYFSYLAQAAARPDVVIGDARRSLRDVPTGTFGAIVVDAFSSDSIPSHLLTAEAIAEYVRVLEPGGMIVVHVSNRYYDLAPAVADAAGSADLVTLVRRYVPTPEDAARGAWPTDAVVATTSPSDRSALVSVGWLTLDSTGPPMTDDFMDVLRFLRPLN
jgi:spermidine synthase